jgi:hypothetical protein
MGQVVVAGLAALCFAFALLLAIGGADRLALLAALSGLTAQSVAFLAHVNDPGRR